MSGFTDYHAHFVYGVDDGAQTREEMYAMLANINGLMQAFIQIPVINSSKERLLICRLIMCQLIPAVFLQTLGCKHLIIQFHIAALYSLDQFLRLSVPFHDLCLIPSDILRNQFTTFL